MSVDAESPVQVFTCEGCGQEFDTREEVVAHWKANHSAKAKAAASNGTPSRQSGPRRTRRGPTKKPSTPKPQPPVMSPVQTGMTITYALVGQAFGMFGPEPKEARNAVAMSMAMTAGQGGYALDRIAARTPFYKLLNGFFGSAGFLEDATPLGIPLIVGMYAYAPEAAKERLRPMAGSVLGLLMLQTFGPEPPASPGDMTPIAMPPWIQEFVDGLLGEAPSPVRKAEAPAA